MFERSGFADIQIQTIRKRTSKKELYEFVVSARKPLTCGAADALRRMHPEDALPMS